MGGYQPGECGYLHEGFASEFGLAVEAVKEIAFGGVVGEKEGGICLQVLKHCLLASSLER